jgi:glycine amidinotransferase/scyllo-inosamine-4-phosphate amidinotransferase 1
MINSYNEWDTLTHVVVGDASFANWPSSDPVFSQEKHKTLWKQTPVPAGAVPDFIIEEANEDLNKLSMTLSDLGVEVSRPTTVNFQQLNGMYNYCPRDRFLIHGSTIIDPAMMYPCRNLEYQCYTEIFEQAERIVHMPRDRGLIFDAANVCRLGPKNMLFLESASGNRAAYEWLCECFPDVNIELCNFYSGVHIDSTIVPLREGLVLLNGSRVTEKNCPKAFDTWDKIYINNVIEQGFYQYPYASKWIALNMLVVDPHTVIVDKEQSSMISLLENYNFTVIPLQLRHSRTLGGGFHCVTLDLHRK